MLKLSYIYIYIYIRLNNSRTYIFTYIRNIIFKNEVDMLLLRNIYVKAWLSEKYSFWLFHCYDLNLASRGYSTDISMKILIGYYKWRGLYYTRLCWEWPTCGGCQLTPWLMIWSHRKGWYFLIWSWDFLALWGMLDAWHYVLKAFQSYDGLIIGLTNKYHKWAIKLFGNYRKVWW